MKYIIWMVLTASILAFAYLTIDDFNRVGVLGSGGFIDSGSKFGITVGISKLEATNKLKQRGLVLGEPTTPGKCLGREIRPDQEVELYDDFTWRRGVICIFAKDNKVIGVAWSYGGWPL